MNKNGIIDEEVLTMKTNQKIEIIKANLVKSDREIGVLIGMNKDQVRHLRLKHGINRDSLFSKDLLKNGFDGDNWSHGWLKQDETSVFVRNEEGMVSYSQMKEDLVREMKKHAPKYPKFKREKLQDPCALVIDPADVHINKLALMEETGGEYNVEIAKQRCIDGVAGILTRASSYNIEKIYFIIGNDVLHTDNPFSTTTAGTRQDTNTMWWKAFLEAKDMYVRIIESLIPTADVHVVFCPSNHDYASGWMLADTLTSWFRNNKNVTFDARIAHRKYVQYGTNMLAFSHGDGAKEGNVKDLMADEEPKLWGETKFRYAYLHHLHHKRKINYLSGKDFVGVTLEYLRSPSPADPWHNRQGYVSPKAIEGFVHSKENGQVARLTHYF